jgi:hypothetical protein
VKSDCSNEVRKREVAGVLIELVYAEFDICETDREYEGGCITESTSNKNKRVKIQRIPI